MSADALEDRPGRTVGFDAAEHWLEENREPLRAALERRFPDDRPGMAARSQARDDADLVVRLYRAPAHQLARASLYLTLEEARRIVAGEREG